MSQSLEQKINEQFEREAEGYVRLHEKLFDAVASSPIFNSNTRDFGLMDAHCIGKQIDNFKFYEQYCAENSSATALGTLPQIAVDLIGAIYGLSVAPILTSMQAIDDQVGLIYFKRVLAQGYNLTSDTNGINAGDATVLAREGWKKSVADYISEAQSRTFTCAASAEQTFYNTVGGTNSGEVIPVRPNVQMRIVLTISGTAYEGVIINLSGNGSFGSVLVSGLKVSGQYTYATGKLELTLPEAAAATDSVKLFYNVDFEKASDIPSIEFELTSDTVTAEVMGVKEMIGTLKSFSFNKRFGKTASDEALADLAGHLAAAESSKVIRKYIELANMNKNVDQSVNTITWYAGRPAGVSEYEHRQSFKYALGSADAEIGERAGRGFANRYIAGYGACKYLKALNGFKAAAPNTGVGPHLYGYIDGAPIIRCGRLDGLGTNDIIAAYQNPTSPFEAPVVTATYMPVFVTNTMQVSNNPFQNQRAIASWKAFKGVVHQFTQKITIAEGVDPNDSVAEIASNTSASSESGSGSASEASGS